MCVCVCACVCVCVCVCKRVKNRYAHKTEYMCYNQRGDISTLDGTPLYLPRKQHLINRKGLRHAANKGMDS